MPVPGSIVHALGAVVIMGMGAANGNLEVDGGVCAWIAGFGLLPCAWTLTTSSFYLSGVGTM